MFNALSALRAIKQGFRRIAKAFEPVFRASGEARPTLNEMRLDADAYVVKGKLGRSFFTRQLRPNTRHARVASLTADEYQLARAHGWL